MVGAENANIDRIINDVGTNIHDFIETYISVGVRYVPLIRALIGRLRIVCNFALEAQLPG